MKIVHQAHEQYETAIVIHLKCIWLVPRNVFILENSYALELTVLDLKVQGEESIVSRLPSFKRNLFWFIPGWLQPRICQTPRN